MCEICERFEGNANYSSLIRKMHETDAKRLENTKRIYSQFDFISAYSTVKYPVSFIHPMFEARAAYAVPHNYFQPMFLNGNALGNTFAHGSMRSIFFSGKNLMIFAKNVSHIEGEEFFNSFLLLHLDRKEYEMRIKDEDITISADLEKTAINLITGKNEKIKVKFNFMNQPVKNRIVSRERVLTSSQLRTVYDKYTALDKKMASVDMEGYAITVPHFSPHPYMLQLAEDVGYSSGRELQEKSFGYFKEHSKN
jgi:hypothetical protein